MFPPEIPLSSPGYPIFAVDHTPGTHAVGVLAAKRRWLSKWGRLCETALGRARLRGPEPRTRCC